MATSRDVANIKDNLYSLTVDGNAFPHYTNMRINLGMIEKAITSADVGQTAVADLVLGHIAEITIEAKELRANLLEFLGLASGVPPAVGTMRSQHAVVVHPVSMGADDSDDIIIPVASFGPSVESTKDGANEDTGSIMIHARHNPDGPVFRIGPEPE